MFTDLLAVKWIQHRVHPVFWGTVMILSFWTDMPGQTVQTQIRLLLWSRSTLFAMPSAWFGLITLWQSNTVQILEWLQQIFGVSKYLGNLKYLHSQKVEPRHDKTNKVTVRPAKTRISLGIRPVWSESSLSAWRNLGSLATHWVHGEDSDQTGQLPRLIWVFAGHTLIWLVLSCRASVCFCFSQ